MFNIKNKKILFLGASIYFYDAALYAKEQGLYIIAVDAQEPSRAIVRTIADEDYTINTTDIEALYKLCLDKKIDGIYAGASEVNIPIAIELCERLNLPYYTNKEQWKMCTNKAVFKKHCIDSDIKVSRVYNLSDKEIDGIITYPVVTKPVDNNGSTGISICKNKKELEAGYEKALNNSKTKTVLIEEFIPSDSVIIQYTIQDGIVKYSGMSDKQSKKINEDAAPVMAIQFFPSEHEEQYLKTVDGKAKKMLQNAGIKFGAIWIEAFYHENNFIFNEIGFRYGGSLTYYPVEFYYGINQMKLLIHHSITGKGLYDNFSSIQKKQTEERYAILPMQIKPCKISEIIGIDSLKNICGFYKFVQSHIEGDIIKSTGTTAQVFGYLHICGSSLSELYNVIAEVKSTLKVLDENGNNQIFTIWENNNI